MDETMANREMLEIINLQVVPVADSINVDELPALGRRSGWRSSGGRTNVCLITLQNTTATNMGTWTTTR